MRYVFALVLACLASCAFAAKIVHTNVYSESMQKELPVSFVFPEDYYASRTDRFAVVYNLAGYGADVMSQFGKRRVAIYEHASDTYGFILVVPDNGGDSWYLDRPKDNKMYETFVAKELVDYVDMRYRTKADRDHRAICGGSMGGHGALFLARTYPEKYGIVDSFSGTVDLLWQSHSFKADKHAGTRPVDECRALVNVEKYKDKDFSLYQDIGIHDHLYDSNKAFHDKLVASGIPHVYVEREGHHNSAYWPEAWRTFFEFAANEIELREKR